MAKSRAAQAARINATVVSFLLEPATIYPLQSVNNASNTKFPASARARTMRRCCQRRCCTSAFTILPRYGCSIHTNTAYLCCSPFTATTHLLRSIEWYTIIAPSGLQGYFPSQFLETYIAPVEKVGVVDITLHLELTAA